MITEKSCGAVLFTRQGDKILYLLVQNRGNYFGFPKGHMEAAETEEETARREIKEETGLDVELWDSFRHENHYTVGEDIAKTSVYFLGEFYSADIRLAEGEISAYAILEFEQARQKLTYASDKVILSAAGGRIKGIEKNQAITSG